MRMGLIMWRIAAVLLTAALLGGCGGKNWGAAADEQLFAAFEPVDPEFAPRYTEEQFDGTLKSDRWPDETAKVRALLPDFGMTTTVKQFTGNMEVRYKVVAGHLNGGNYEVTMDLFRFRPEDGEPEDGKCDNSASADCKAVIQKVRIGVGVRVIAHISVAEAGAKLAGLTSFGANASLENMSGTVSAYSYGIDPVPLDFKALAAAAPLDKGVLATILKGAADILDKLQADNVKLKPHLFAIKRLRPVTEPQTADAEVRKTNSVLHFFKRKEKR